MDLKPRPWHEQHLGTVDKHKIVQHLDDGQGQDVTTISAILARQRDLYVHFQRLWIMRVTDLCEAPGTEKSIKRTYYEQGSSVQVTDRLSAIMTSGYLRQNTANDRIGAL